MKIDEIHIWHDAKLDPPPEYAAGERVLVCIERDAWKDGCDEPVRKRDIDIGWHIDGRWHVDGVGKGLRVLFWMPLPKWPHVGDFVILESAWLKELGRKQDHDGLSEGDHREGAGQDAKGV